MDTHETMTRKGTTTMATTTTATTMATTATTATTASMAASGATTAAAMQPVPRGRPALRRAMTMAALAAVLALGGVLGLHPRAAEATPRTLARATPARTGGPATSPDGDDRPADTPTPAPATATTGDGATAGETDVDDAPEPGGRASAGRGGKRVSGKVNLNTATAEQLMLLPGIGPAKAERVLAWRKRNGMFRRVVDLRRVKGFGYRTLKKLEPHLDVKGESTLRAGP